VFKLSTNGALTTLHSFTFNGDGANPQATLVQGNDGNFYGTTSRGGTNGDNGTVFKIGTNGALTTLYSFTGGHDGADPGGLVKSVDGNFYGISSGGNTNLNNGYGYGTVFELGTNGALTTLYSFSGGSDGADPGGLVQAGDGNFYGTTVRGGAGGAGTVFRMTILPEPPELNITPSAAGFVLTWPTNYAGFILQSTTNLGSPVWSTDSPAPLVVDGHNTVTNPTSGAQQFFRLKQ
jgi:uncharacterized repeat protein (TIGR03803 family)